MNTPRTACNRDLQDFPSGLSAGSSCSGILGKCITIESVSAVLFCSISIGKDFYFRSYVSEGDGENVESDPSIGGVRPDLSFPHPSAASKV